jgi:aspartyl-tRNA(Asn)/glutamyl-tRNA(Gln) amidotransferase subunit B
MYFPDPDLPKFYVDDSMMMQESNKILPEKMFKNLCKTYGYQETFLNMVEEPFVSSFVKHALAHSNHEVQKQILKLISGEIFARLKEDDAIPINPLHLQKLAQIIIEKNLSSAIIKTILDAMWEDDQDPEEIIQEKGLHQIEDEGVIRGYVREVLSQNPAEVEKYFAGKTNLRGFFLGQLMKKGKIEPRLLNKILDEELKNLG